MTSRAPRRRRSHAGRPHARRLRRGGVLAAAAGAPGRQRRGRARLHERRRRRRRLDCSATRPARRDRVPRRHHRRRRARGDAAAARAPRRHRRLRAALERRRQRGHACGRRGYGTRRLRAAGVRRRAALHDPARAGRRRGRRRRALLRRGARPACSASWPAPAAITAPPERDVDGDGRVGALRTGGPPAAVIEGVATFGVGTHCRADRGCVDMVAPACGDGRRRARWSRPATPLRFLLGFEPAAPPVLTIPRGGDPVAGARSPPVGRSTGRSPYRLGATPSPSASSADRGDVAYTACLDVEGPHRWRCPAAPLSHRRRRCSTGGDVTRAGSLGVRTPRRAPGAGTRRPTPTPGARSSPAAAPAAALVSGAIGDTPWCVVLRDLRRRRRGRPCTLRRGARRRRVREQRRGLGSARAAGLAGRGRRQAHAR